MVGQTSVVFKHDRARVRRRDWKMPGFWCLVFSVWCLVFQVSCFVFRVSFLVFLSVFEVSGWRAFGPNLIPLCISIHIHLRPPSLLPLPSLPCLPVAHPPLRHACCPPPAPPSLSPWFWDYGSGLRVKDLLLKI